MRPLPHLRPDPGQMEHYMRLALEEAREAAAKGEIPVGAVIVGPDGVVARGHNLTQTLNDVTAHAEMIALTAAAEYMGGKYLPECALYVTVEPCIMCAGALGWSQIGAVFFGTPDPRRGFLSYYGNTPDARSPLHPRTVMTGGILEDECKALMQEFFRNKR